MNRAKIALIAVILLIVTLGSGYIWGAWGRFALGHALDDARLQLDLSEARGHLLDARVSLYNVNFGDASKHFEEAKAPLGRAQERYRTDGNSSAANSIATAMEHTTEGQRLAAKLDQTANARAEQALNAIKLATEK
jgi:hypothetical protein